MSPALVLLSLTAAAALATSTLLASPNYICGPSPLSFTLTIRQAGLLDVRTTQRFDRRKQLYGTTETRSKSVITGRYGTAEYLEDLRDAGVIPDTTVSGWALWAIPEGPHYKIEARKSEKPSIPLDPFLNIRSFPKATTYTSTRQSIFLRGNGSTVPDRVTGSGTFSREGMAELNFKPLTNGRGEVLVPTLELIGRIVSNGIEHRWYPDYPVNQTNQSKAEILTSATLAGLSAPYFDPNPADTFFASGSASLGPASPIPAP